MKTIMSSRRDVTAEELIKKTCWKDITAFPIKPRLQKLFKSSEIANHMG